MSVEDRFQNSEELREWLLSLNWTKIRFHKHECAELKKKFDELSIELLQKKAKLDQAKRAFQIASMQFHEVDDSMRRTYKQHRLHYFEWQDEYTSMDVDRHVKVWGDSAWKGMEDMRPRHWYVAKWCVENGDIAWSWEDEKDA